MDWQQMFYGPQSLNHELFMLINQAAHPVLDVIMPFITHLGDVWVYYLYFLLLGLACLKNRKWLPARHLTVVIIAYFFALVVETGLKHLLSVPRPAAAIGVENIRVLGKIKLHHALPSGHAVLSFVFAFCLSYRRGMGWKLPLYLFAVLVAYSRIYVGAHYPLDVIFGAFVGIACGYMVWKGYEGVEGIRRR